MTETKYMLGNRYSGARLALQKAGGVLLVASAVLLSACAGDPVPGAAPGASRSNPAIPRAAFSALPEFRELYRLMATLYADHPQAPRWNELDFGSRKISVARVREPGSLAALKPYREQNIHGRIVVISLVDENGKLLDARILSSSHPELNETMLESARSAVYRGGKINQTPAPMYAVYGVNF